MSRRRDRHRRGAPDEDADLFERLSHHALLEGLTGLYESGEGRVHPRGEDGLSGEQDLVVVVLDQDHHGGIGAREDAMAAALALARKARLTRREFSSAGLAMLGVAMPPDSVAS